MFKYNRVKYILSSFLQRLLILQWAFEEILRADYAVRSVLQRFPLENGACRRLPFQEPGVIFRKPQLDLCVGTLHRVRLSQNTFEVLYRVSRKTRRERDEKKLKKNRCSVLFLNSLRWAALVPVPILGSLTAYSFVTGENRWNQVAVGDATLAWKPRALRRPNLRPVLFQVSTSLLNSITALGL